MILPIGDTPNPTDYRPWVTWLLIAANVGVYLLFTLPLGASVVDLLNDPAAEDYRRFIEDLARSPLGDPLFVPAVSAWDLAVFEYGYRPSDPQLSDLFTSMFMHAGFAHLFGNMLFLWIYGDNVEHRLGRIPFLLMYVASGIVATLSFAWLAGDAPTPLVGASGAISGILGMYFVAFPRNRIRMLVGLPPLFFNVLLVPAWIVLAFYVVGSNLLPLLSGASSNVAYGAHLGGFATGVTVAVPLVFGAMMLPRRGSSTVRGALDEAARSERAAQPAQARQTLLNAMRGADGDDRAALQLALGQLLARYGRNTEAYQWLFRASQHPTTAAAARRTMAEIGLDPRLMERLGRF